MKGRLPLTIAFKYKVMDVASVLLHLGADHPTNHETRQMKGVYIHNVLKGKLFGLNNMQTTTNDLAKSQVYELMKVVYPKFDNKVTRLL